MRGALDVINSTATSSLRAWQGTMAKPAAVQPEKLLQLYEFESCPYCRLVREVLTELDLDAMIYPCPQGGKRYRGEAEDLGGRRQFPFLRDPNTGEEIYESDRIIAYLYETYGKRKPPMGLREAAVAGSIAASLVRGNQKALASLQPDQPLVLYSFESSPFCRRVREILCELEIAYELRSAGKALLQDMGPPALRKLLFASLPVEGRNRKRLLQEAGKVQLPYLFDPNTGVGLFESADINRYLLDTYRA